MSKKQTDWGGGWVGGIKNKKTKSYTPYACGEMYTGTHCTKKN